MAEAVRVERTRSSDELALAFEIRRRVFVEEQGIPASSDRDGLDGGAIHVLAWIGETAVGTGRLVVDDQGGGVVARIAVLAGHRGVGTGRALVLKLEQLARESGVSLLELHPHRHLERFYSGLGYRKAPGGETSVGRYRLLTMTKRLDGK